MIELNQLEQLIYIAENKTISKAAKELLISQPALSRSMQKLESFCFDMQMLCKELTTRKIYGILCERRKQINEKRFINSI